MRDKLYQLLRVCVYWPSAAATGVLGGLSRVKPDTLRPHLAGLVPTLVYLQDKQWIAFFTAAIMGLAAAGMKALGHPWVKGAICHVLEAMHQHAFDGESGREPYFDRVTLFRYHDFCWRFWIVGKPWGGFLVPYARSGHFFQNPSVVFRVPHNVDDAEGVAGQAFVLGASISVTSLPDVSKKATPSDEDFRVYAQKTWVREKWLRNERSTARALLAIRILVRGRPWGSIVVDTRAETIPNDQAVVQSYTLVAKVLGELLERS